MKYDRASGTENRGLDGTVPPPEIDLNIPSVARAYDFILGGKDHFEVDRRASDALYAAVPETGDLARSGRDLIRRTVTHLVADVGIRQIIDIGSGLPTVGNVHEIAHRVDPSVHVVYVDKDPIVLAHGRALLADEERTTVITADIRDPDAIFDNPTTRDFIDYDKPYAVLAVSILHHLHDEDALVTAEALKARLDPGAYLLLANFVDDDEPRAKELERAFLEGGLGTGRFRTWAELRRFNEGLDLVEPGLVYANDWHPDDETPVDSAVHTLFAAAMGRKR
ncbi:SAM-dependent methyltransferase [Pseudonocardia sp. CA-142604]|uniref:SAM-dependent methyltransferase n=1 Tax=Pseudonocardia sp. CA-142604 TaxID=3240024 RepID=UPI003D8C0A4E